MNSKLYRIILYVIFAAGTAAAQAGEFTFPGELTDPGSRPNAAYDMQFRLFDNANAGQGTQQGVTVTKPAVVVSNGLFNVALDFGTTPFAAGAERYLEVSIRPAGSTGGYTAMAPRQILTSAPYSFQLLSTVSAQTAEARQLAGTSAGQDVGINDRVGVLLLNALKEQQAQIEAQKIQNAELQREVEKLRELVRSNGAQVDELRTLIICRTTMRPELCGVEK